MYRKLAILYIFILIFYVVIAPCLNLEFTYKKEKLQYTSPISTTKTENNCRSSSVNPGIMNRLSLSCNQFFYTFIERKPILHEEFESVVVEEKFRPQEARKMTDGNTNKCLLLANDCAIIMKGDFVTVQTCV